MYELINVVKFCSQLAIILNIIELVQVSVREQRHACRSSHCAQ